MSINLIWVQKTGFCNWFLMELTWRDSCKSLLRSGAIMKVSEHRERLAVGWRSGCPVSACRHGTSSTRIMLVPPALPTRMPAVITTRSFFLTRRLRFNIRNRSVKSFPIASPAGTRKGTAPRNRVSLRARSLSLVNTNRGAVGRGPATCRAVCPVSVNTTRACALSSSTKRLAA